MMARGTLLAAVNYREIMRPRRGQIWALLATEGAARLTFRISHARLRVSAEPRVRKHASTHLFGCDRVDDVYFHGLDPVVADPADIAVANARGGLSIHGVDRASQTGTHHNRPPVFRSPQSLTPALQDDFGVGNAAVLHELANLFRQSDAIPASGWGIQIRPLGPHRFPPDGMSGLEITRPPGRDRQLAAGFYHAPQLPNQAFHVGNKKHAEHADDRVEIPVRESERRHVAPTKFHVMKPALCRFGSRQVEKLVREIDSENPSARACPLRRRQSGGAGAAPDVERRKTAAEIEPIDRAATDHVPIGEGSIIVMVGRAVEGCRYLDLGGLGQIEFFHTRLPAIATIPQTLAGRENQHQSNLIAPPSITFRLRSSAARMKAVNSSAVEAITSMPAIANFSLTSGCRKALTNASCSLRATSGGMPAAAANPSHLVLL